MAGAGPAHALYFGSYEMSKELMTKFTTHNHINYSKYSNPQYLEKSFINNHRFQF